MSAPISLDLFSLPPFLVPSEMYIFREVMVDTISINADVTEEVGLFVMLARMSSKSEFKSRKDVSFIPDIVRLADIGKISDVPIEVNNIVYIAHYIEVLCQPLFYTTIHYSLPISVVVDVVGTSDAMPIVDCK